MSRSYNSKGEDARSAEESHPLRDALILTTIIVLWWFVAYSVYVAIAIYLIGSHLNG